MQRMVAGRHLNLIPANYLEKIAGLRGIRKKEGRLWGYYFDPTLKSNCTVMVPPAGSTEAVEAGWIALGETLARGLGLKVNDEIMLPSILGEAVYVPGGACFAARIRTGIS